tara:strand:- start:64 stop:516 length:453 start_codon:yes stop_codon:yes gene_type:complete
MINKIITLFIFLLLTSCEYTPIYSSKNFDLDLRSIINQKNDRLHSNINKRLKNFSNKKSQKKIHLVIDAKKIISTLSKDTKGDPSRYEMIISINLEIKYDENKSLITPFQEKFNYNTNSNKFELNQYEKEIENLLIDKIIENIIIYLSKI